MDAMRVKLKRGVYKRWRSAIARMSLLSFMVGESDYWAPTVKRHAPFVAFFKRMIASQLFYVASILILAKAYGSSCDASRQAGKNLSVVDLNLDDHWPAPRSLGLLSELSPIRIQKNCYDSCDHSSCDVCMVVLNRWAGLPTGVPTVLLFMADLPNGLCNLSRYSCVVIKEHVKISYFLNFWIVPRS